MPLNAKLFEKLFGRYKAFTKIVFHTNVEAGIRGVIGLLIVLRPGSIKLRHHRSALAILFDITNP